MTDKKRYTLAMKNNNDITGVKPPKNIAEQYILAQMNILLRYKEII